MFTICPSCTRQFRITAEHIAAASGQVRCGYCNEQFSALERLYDEPLTNERILNEIQLSVEVEQEPQFDIPEKKASEHVSDDILISKSTQQTGTELETAINEIGIQQTVNHAEAVQQEVEEIDPEAATIRKNEIKQNLKEKKYEFPEPEEFLEEPATKSNVWLRVFWTFASIVAFIIIVGQLAWFNRDEVLLKYPELRPYVKQICQELDCRIIRTRDPGAIKLINRDVRLHPTYEDTLLVNATMQNELEVRQPYPRVQLTIFDTAGTLLGYRDFVPADYLDDSIDVDEGMPVNLPVHFVLEVTGPTAGAVSFEFRFL